MFNQNNFLSSTSQGKIHYWQKQLANIAPLIDFPTDRSRSVISNLDIKNNYQANSGQELIGLSQALNLALNQVAKERQVPVAVVLLSAFHVLLYRYTNQEDIVVGCLDLFDPVDKNTLEILPVRVSIQGQQPFSQLLKTIQVKISEAYDYSNLNLDSLSTGLAQDNPEFLIASLSQMLFRYRSVISKSAANLIGLRPSRELFLDIIEKEQNLSCKIKYDQRLFAATTIKRILANYQVLLQAIALDPQG